MPDFSTPGILLRRIEHGDYDLILTFLTKDSGKLSVMAKYARKSVKRFSGVLELFYVLDLVCSASKGKLPILKEAGLRQPFYEIRKNIENTAYASYWAQLVHQWMEDGQKETRLYELLLHVLNSLDENSCEKKMLSVLFQMKFLVFSGLTPNLSQCSRCGKNVRDLRQSRFWFDLARGGLMCKQCASDNSGLSLSLGTIKQLRWIGAKPVKMARRVRFSETGIKESLSFLESFLPFHLGFKPRSLAFLKQIRDEKI